MYYTNPQPSAPASQSPHKQQSKSLFKRKASTGSDAGSVDYLEMNGPTPFDMRDELQKEMYGTEFDIGIAAEPRDIYKANHIPIDQKASENLKCLWVSVLLLFVFAMAAATCVDQYVLSIYGHSSEAGFYYWAFGWTNAEFYPEDTALSAEQIPLTFVKRYAVDAGRFFIVSVLIIVLCLSVVTFLLCSRSVNEAYLYILCCGIRIPQAPTLYILFSTLKHYSRIAIYLCLFCIIYGMLEMNFYANFVCQALGGACTNFGIPHYGTVALFLVGLLINCVVTKRVTALDKAFNAKTIGYYYPDHVRRMNTRDCGISLAYLKASLHTIRILIICASVIYIAFHSVGLILIGDWDKTTLSFSLFFQFMGLVNAKQSDSNGTKYANISEADNFVRICWTFYNLLLPFVMAFNGLILCYFYYVILKFRSLFCCKFLLIALMCLEWLAFTLMALLYYYTFYVFWRDYLKDNREESAYYNPESSYDLFWCPDWGIILLVLMDWYILKLIFFTFKAI